MRLAELGVFGMDRVDPPERSRYRFHQPLRSETKCSSPAGDQRGSPTDSSAPPATRRASPGTPAASSAATQSSLPCHGMRGWSQLSQARRVPSSERRGLEKKSWPDASTVSAPLARSMATIAFTASLATPCSSRTAIRRPRAASTTRSAKRRFPGAVTGCGSVAADAIDALVGVMAEEELAVGRDREGAAAVFVDPRSCVVGRGIAVDGAARTVAFDDDAAAAFTRAAFAPVDVLADDRDLAEADRRRREQLGAERRRPAAERCLLLAFAACRFGHGTLSTAIAGNRERLLSRRRRHGSSSGCPRGGGSRERSSSSARPPASTP